jgi:hypothetical protein
MLLCVFPCVAVTTGFGLVLYKMDYKKLKKPQNLKEEVWDQHLDWMDVMGQQVEQNYSRHLARVKEDASRSESLTPLHEQVAQAPHCTQSLFSDSEH